MTSGVILERCFIDWSGIPRSPTHPNLLSQVLPKIAITSSAQGGRGHGVGGGVCGGVGCPKPCAPELLMAGRKPGNWIQSFIEMAHILLCCALYRRSCPNGSHSPPTWCWALTGAVRESTLQLLWLTKAGAATKGGKRKVPRLAVDYVTQCSSCFPVRWLTLEKWV